MQRPVLDCFLDKYKNGFNSPEIRAEDWKVPHRSQSP